MRIEKRSPSSWSLPRASRKTSWRRTSGGRRSLHRPAVQRRHPDQSARDGSGVRSNEQAGSSRSEGLRRFRGGDRIRSAWPGFPAPAGPPVAAVLATGEVRNMINKLMLQPHHSAATVQRQAEHIRFLRQELMEMSSSSSNIRSRRLPSWVLTRRQSHRIGDRRARRIVSATERATLEILKGAERIGARSPDCRNRHDQSDPSRDRRPGHGDHDLLLVPGYYRTTHDQGCQHASLHRAARQSDDADPHGRSARRIEVPDEQDARPDAHLLNGPASDGGVSQGDIDALFN